MLAVACLATLAASAPASGATHAFSGSCTFAGPILPHPGITVLPSTDAYFDLHATGSCAGTVDGVAAPAAPLVIDFVKTKTFLDTCEIGPDLGLAATMKLSTPSGDVLIVPITINMLRVAVAAPFILSGSQGGTAPGFAQFVPDDLAAALSGCAPGQAGITKATLKGSFNTSQPLVGTVAAAPGQTQMPAPVPAPGPSVTVTTKALKNVGSTLTLGVATTLAGRLSAKLVTAGRTTASSGAKAAAAGMTRLVLRLTNAARRTLARSHRLPAALSVTYTPSGGRPQTVRRTLTLRRAR